MDINQSNQYGAREGAFITRFLDQSAKDYAAVELAFDVTSYNDSEYKNLGIFFPEVIAKSVIKRKAEFLAGRYAALQCFKKLRTVINMHEHFSFADNFDLQIGMHRYPLWPQKFIGSISHTNSSACALVTSIDNYQGVGIDIEDWLPSSSYNQIAPLVLAGNDYSIVRNFSHVKHLSFQRILTLIFSAKESLFKALYPSVGHYFDFKDAEVTKFDCKQGFLWIRLLKSLGAQPWLHKYAEHKVQFFLRKDNVYTYVLLELYEGASEKSLKNDKFPYPQLETYCNGLINTTGHVNERQ